MFTNIKLGTNNIIVLSIYRLSVLILKKILLAGTNDFLLVHINKNKLQAKDCPIKLLHRTAELKMSGGN